MSRTALRSVAFAPLVAFAALVAMSCAPSEVGDADAVGTSDWSDPVGAATFAVSGVEGQVPAPIIMRMTPPAGVTLGSPAVFTVSAAPAGAPVFLLASPQAIGPAACPGPLSPECLGIPNPVFVVASGAASGAGVVTLALTPPPSLSVAEISFQAASLAGGLVYVSTPAVLPVSTAPIDADGDGFSPPSDCNDADPSIYPGAPEVCDAIDNDCDSLVDAGDGDLQLVPCALQAGVCSGSTTTPAMCQAGAWLSCDTSTYAAWSPSYEPAELTCDALDNDCNAVPDDITVFDDNNCGGCGLVCGVGFTCSAGSCVATP
ncbi:MAG: putative metal-binding motif-containing protein [Alphaproteobacteria bacterium]|nr:putative metal-binding motif-containing protein [Alphaproteobacteria bacterium]